MKQMSEKLMKTCESEVKGGTGTSLKIQKPHRRVMSGLRLLSESYQTARANSNVSTSEIKFSLKDEEEEADVLKKLSELPHDVLMHQILTRLPVKSLLQSKSVSKEWYSTVSSTEFANVHFKTRLFYYSSASPIECLFIQAGNTSYLFYLQEEDIVLDYHLVKLEPSFDCNNQSELCLVGSCNGLVCLTDSFTGYLYVWNPLTYHCQKFPNLSLFSYNYRTSWGFAYVSSFDDYKMVRIAENYETREIIVLVFSLQTKEWKHIHDHRLDPRVCLTKTNAGVLVNDTLYWVMATRDPTKKHIVVGFDLALEKFDEILGLIPRSTSFHDHFLCVMGGCLSLCSSNMHMEAYLSILKRPGEVESVSLSSYSDSWSYSSLVGLTKTGKSFVVSKNWELALVDLSSSRRQYFPLVTFQEAHKPCMVGYFPSLIPPFVV